jgi:hypothetical protein
MISTDSRTRFGAVAVAAAFALPASGQTASDKMQFCEASGKVALATTAARDAGITKEQASALVVDAKVDAQQVAFFSALISLIYAMEGVEGPLMQQVAIQMCHKSMGLK